MDNALAEPQTIVLLGGTSDIGRAIVERLVTPATRTIVLAGRRPGEMRSDELARPGVTVDTVHFDAANTDTHEAFVADLVAGHGDLDVVVVAFGQLVDQAKLDTDPAAAAAMVTVNYTGAVSSCLALAAQFRRQGHGRLVVLSSVAGERVRKANFVYGSSKAGLDGFAQGLGDALAGIWSQRARRAARLRPLADDRGDEGGAVRHDPRRRRRRHRQGARSRPAHRLGSGHAAPGVQRRSATCRAACGGGSRWVSAWPTRTGNGGNRAQMGGSSCVSGSAGRAPPGRPRSRRRRRSGRAAPGSGRRSRTPSTSSAPSSRPRVRSG